MDNIPGTTGNDTIIAGEGSVGGGGVHTLGSSDVINGGSGTDTLNLKLAGTAGAGQVVTPNIAAVEIFNVQAIGAANGAGAAGNNGINLINATGYTELWSNNSTNDLDLVNVGTKAVVGVTKGVAAADYSVQYAAAAVTGAQDVVLDTATVGNLFIDSLGTGAAVATGFATVNVDAKAGTSTVGNLQSGGDITTLNVTGAGKLTITAAQNAALKTIDASANTGGTTLQIAAFSGQNVTYTGGSGNDSINFNDTLTLLDKVDGGAGRNTLVVDDQTSIVTGLNVSNIQVLSLDNLNNATVEAGRIAGVDQVNVTTTLGAGITGGAADSKINGLSSGNTVAIADSGAVLINVKNATVAGTADTFNLEVSNSASVNFQLPGVETINLSNKTAASFSAVSFSDADGLVDLRTLNISSAADSVTTAWDLNNTIKTVDASAALGDVGVSVLAGNPTNGVAITGGAGDDWLIGGDGKDVIVGGAGNDRIQGDANSGTAQVTTVAVGTTDIGDTYTLSINGTVVTVEAMAATGANVEGLLATAINGNAIITAQGISADATSGDLVITGDAAGHAFTVANLDSTNAAARAETSTIALAIGADDGDTYRVTIGGTGTAADKNYDTAFAADATTAQARAAIITTLNSDADFVAQGFTAALNAAGEIAVTGPVGNDFTLALAEQIPGVPTAQVDTITFVAGDLAAGNIFTTTINGTSVNYTMTGTAATDSVGLVNAINTAFGATVTAAFVDVDVTAGVQATDKLTITADAAGTGFTSAISVNGAAAASAIANTTANDPVTTLAGNFVITETQAALVAGATANSAASLTVTETQVPVLGGTANADTLTGGDGNDTFVVLASGGKVGTSFTTMDTITDLNLGGSAVASQIDAVDLSFAVTSLVNAGVPVALTTAPTLVEAVDVLFAAGGVLNNQANKAGLFTYAGDTYLVAANGAGATFGADDVIVKVTGVQGTLDLSDLV